MTIKHFAYGLVAVSSFLAVPCIAQQTEGSGGDTVAIPVGSQGPAGMELPSRGLTRESVEEQFGVPGEVFAAVGEPPISRWLYPDFTVYFEGNIVIHSVANHTPAGAAVSPQ